MGALSILQSDICCCYMKVSGGNCYMKRSPFYGDLHVEPERVASPWVGERSMCRADYHSASGPGPEDQPPPGAVAEATPRSRGGQPGSRAEVEAGNVLAGVVVGGA